MLSDLAGFDLALFELHEGRAKNIITTTTKKISKWHQKNFRDLGVIFAILHYNFNMPEKKVTSYPK